jgi:hypothetical protein
MGDSGEDSGVPSTEHGRASAGPRELSVSSEAYSFLLFCSLTLSAVILFPGYLVIFLVIVEVDGLATLASSDIVVSVDRSTFFLAFLALSVSQGSHGLFFLFLEVVLAIAALDFSFLLRRIRGTVVDSSVLKNRLGSYAYTAVPAFLLSYSLTLLYSFISGVPLPDPLALLAVSSTAALFAIYVVSRFLSSRIGPNKR